MRIALVTLLALTTLPFAAQQPPATPACADLDEMHLLDFWLGEWNVYVSDQKVGTNRIEPILGGCAILENWTDARGGEGKSLFYYHPAEKRWKQVWVTDNALAPGGTKEKSLVGTLEGGALRFRGTITLQDGRTYLDRTTLTPLEDGSVRQVIEISTDGGKTWVSRFDAAYERKSRK